MRLVLHATCGDRASIGTFRVTDLATRAAYVGQHNLPLILAQAGIQHFLYKDWMPACTGMSG